MLSFAIRTLGAHQKWPDIQSCLNRVATLQSNFPDNEALALEELQVLSFAIHTLGAHQKWPDIQSCLNRVATLQSNFPDNEALALEEATLLSINVVSLGLHQKWSEMKDCLDRIAKLQSKFPEHGKIAERRLIALIVACGVHFKAEHDRKACTEYVQRTRQLMLKIGLIAGEHETLSAFEAAFEALQLRLEGD